MTAWYSNNCHINRLHFHWLVGAAALVKPFLWCIGPMLPVFYLYFLCKVCTTFIQKWVVNCILSYTRNWSRALALWFWEFGLSFSPLFVYFPYIGHIHSFFSLFLSSLVFLVPCSGSVLPKGDPPPSLGATDVAYSCHMHPSLIATDKTDWNTRLNYREIFMTAAYWLNVNTLVITRSPDDVHGRADTTQTRQDQVRTE